MKAYIVAGAFAAGLLAGCGGGEENGLETEQPSLASREDRLLCITQYTIAYYSDATYTTQVGSENCWCGNTPVRQGTRTAYRQVLQEESCQ